MSMRCLVDHMGQHAMREIVGIGRSEGTKKSAVGVTSSLSTMRYEYLAPFQSIYIVSPSLSSLMRVNANR